MELESADSVPLQLFADRSDASLQRPYVWDSVLGSDVLATQISSTLVMTTVLAYLPDTL